MIKVGLTGGIGSGKSLISRIFNIFGVPVYNSDFEAKSLYQTDYYLTKELISQYGKEVYLDNGQINAKYLASIVFKDKTKLNQLNSLVHPRVKIHFDNWLRNKIQFPYIIKETAILFESSAYKYVDKVVVVAAPDEIRVNRVIERDSINKDSILERMKNQIPQEMLIKKADFVIVNDGLKPILPQVYVIHKQLIGIV